MLLSGPHLTTASVAAAALRPPLRRWFSISLSTSSNSVSWPALPVLSDSSPASFRDTALTPNRPIKLPRSSLTPSPPAIQKWFSPAPPSPTLAGTSSTSARDTGSIPNYAYLDPFASTTILPMELVTDDDESNHSPSSKPSKSLPTGSSSSSNTNTKTKTFTRASAPLALWLSWSKLVLNSSHPLTSSSPSTSLAPSTSRPPSTSPPPSLYIAQSPLSHLPQTLQHDLPTPDLVLSVSGSRSGNNASPTSDSESQRESNASPKSGSERGSEAGGPPHIYDTSLWMGIPPTYTPLHRDGNANVLMQLAGWKVVRLVEPAGGGSGGGGDAGWVAGSRKKVGGRQGREAERMGKVGMDMGMGTNMNAKIGLDEAAMQGIERERMERLVWGSYKEEHDEELDEEEADKGWIEWEGRQKYEVVIGQGEGVFIPAGWWHSVKGAGKGVTASVNWWFR